MSKWLVLCFLCVAFVGCKQRQAVQPTGYDTRASYDRRSGACFDYLVTMPTGSVRTVSGSLVRYASLSYHGSDIMLKDGGEIVSQGMTERVVVPCP
jgi:hypothetical protein